jgi:hypothetical protein
MSQHLPCEQQQGALVWAAGCAGSRPLVSVGREAVASSVWSFYALVVWVPEVPLSYSIW